MPSRVVARRINHADLEVYLSFCPIAPMLHDMSGGLTDDGILLEFPAQESIDEAGLAEPARTDDHNIEVDRPRNLLFLPPYQQVKVGLVVEHGYRLALPTALAVGLVVSVAIVQRYLFGKGKIVAERLDLRPKSVHDWLMR